MMIVHVELSIMSSVFNTMVISGDDVCCSVVFVHWLWCLYTGWCV